MNKKIVTLILVILISFCFLSIVVADNITNDDNNTDDHDKTIDEDDDDSVNENTIDKKKTTDKNKKSDKSKKNYILAKGNGNYITFSDGFKGFILDYSKSPASSGDEFKRVSASKASNSNTLKLAIIECYKQNSVGQIEKIMADFVKTGSSSTKVGESVAASYEEIYNHEVVKINNNTVAFFDFEVLKSVSGNESDYFAYKVSFITIDDGEEVDQTYNENDTTAEDFDTTIPGFTNTTNITNVTRPSDNQTNATFLDYLNDYLDYLANGIYDSWKPIIDLLVSGFLMFTNFLEGIVKLFEDFIMTIRSLVEVLEKLLVMLGMIWGTLDGILKILCMIFTALLQLIDLIAYIFNIIVGLLSTLISLVQQILGLLSGFINFLMDIINQIMSLLQAGFAFLKSTGSSLANVLENALIIITAFVIITIGAFVYDRKYNLH